MNFNNRKKSVFAGKYNYKHIVVIGVLCLFIAFIHGQIRPKQLRMEVLKSQEKPKEPQKKKRKGNSFSPSGNPSKPLAPIVTPYDLGVKLVFLENSESLNYDQLRNPDVKILRGNVKFRHENALMYCDSAYFYEKANSLDAFGHVKIVQGDTLFIFGDVLYYDGNIKLARLRNNVRMENKKTTLVTDSMNYDRNTSLAYYFTGGRIYDQVNTLSSVWGQYSTRTNDAFFKQNVKLDNKDYWLRADSLHYNTRSHIANMIGKTHINYKGETDVYTTRGWYNTTTGRSMLLDRSQIKHKTGKTLTGDTLFYDKTQNYGEAFMHVALRDSVQRTTLYGNYCYYSKQNQVGMACDSAVLLDWSSKDSMWVHADTLYTSKDSIYNSAKGYYHVRFYRNDVQGICDSLTYSARDSIMNMHGDPVIWAQDNQLSGDFIQVHTKNKKVNRVHIQHAAIAIQQSDSVFFNQVSGKEIIAHVDSNQLKKVNVNGNAETIYYPMDDKDSTLIGLNHTESSFVVMFLKNKKIDKVVLTSASNGSISPIIGLKEDQLYLKNFFWLAQQRPKNPIDVFTIYPKFKRPKAGELPQSKTPPGIKPSKEDAKKAKKLNPDEESGRMKTPPTAK